MINHDEFEAQPSIIRYMLHQLKHTSTKKRCGLSRIMAHVRKAFNPQLSIDNPGIKLLRLKGPIQRVEILDRI